MKIFLITTCLVTCLSVRSSAQLSASTSTSVSIVNPIEFSKVEDMKFQTHAIRPSPVTRQNSRRIIETTAEFSIRDLASNCISVTVTALPITFNIPGEKVVLRNLKNDFESRNAALNGSQSLKIRGDLYIDSTAEAGLYSNSRDMVVVINYN